MQYDLSELRKKITQRETWLYVSGIGISIAHAFGGIDLDWDELIAVVAPLLGVGGAAHIARAKQRSDEIVARVRPAVQDARELAEDVWNPENEVEEAR